MFPFWGSGSGTYARKLSEKLVSPEDEVAIVAPDNRKIKGVRLFEVKLPFFVAITGHSEHLGCKLYSELKPTELNNVLVSFYSKVIEAVDKFKPDIIHVHHASHLTWIAHYIRAIYGIPFITIEHGTGILNSTMDNRYLTLTKDALNKSEYIVCVSGDTKKWFLRVYGRKYVSKIRIRPGGVDLEKYNHNSKIKIIDKKYRLSDRKVVIFAGKLTKNKGVDYLVKAARSIDADIFILGSGDELSKLKKMANDQKIKNIHFLGYFGPEYIDELREFYKRADVFVCPSVWDEPLGLVLLESMASGTPTVASRKGGIPLVVKNNFNGLLIKARSSKAIADAVNKLLSDDKLRKRLGKNARKTVEERFNWLDIAKRFKDLSASAINLNSKRIEKIKNILGNIDSTRVRIDVKNKKIGDI